MPLTVIIKCADCGVEATADATGNDEAHSYPGSHNGEPYQRGQHFMSVKRIRVPEPFHQNLNYVARCEPCHDRWYEQMRPIWNANEQGRKDRYRAKIGSRERAITALLDWNHFDDDATLKHEVLREMLTGAE